MRRREVEPQHGRVHVQDPDDRRSEKSTCALTHDTMRKVVQFKSSTRDDRIYASSAGEWQSIVGKQRVRGNGYAERVGCYDTGMHEVDTEGR